MQAVIAGTSDSSPKVIRQSSATAIAQVAGDGRDNQSQLAFYGRKIRWSFSTDRKSYTAFPFLVMRKAENSVARDAAGQCVHSFPMDASMIFSEAF